MLKLDEKTLDVNRHTDATAASGIVPFDANAHKFIPCHVELHTMELLQKIEEMAEVCGG
jgi:hypothetical protein